MAEDKDKDVANSCQVPLCVQLERSVSHLAGLYFIIKTLISLQLWGSDDNNENAADDEDDDTNTEYSNGVNINK